MNHCILFGLPATKDAVGSSAWAEDGVVQQAIRAIKAKCPDFYVITDVCMCEYTDHGHCGILWGHEVDNDKALEVLAKTASAFYGPFRSAAGSAPSFGDWKGYQMAPLNGREALKECALV